MWSPEDISVLLPSPIPLAPPRRLLRWRETPDAWLLEGPLSGFRKKDLAIDARDRVLEIRAERERGGWIRPRECRAFRQVVMLPDGADASAIDARFADGELSVRVAKLPSARRRKIPVRTITSRASAS